MERSVPVNVFANGKVDRPLLALNIVHGRLEGMLKRKNNHNAMWNYVVVHLIPDMISSMSPSSKACA